VKTSAGGRLILAGALLVSAGAAARPPDREAACRENNRGVALLEQYEHQRAAEAFRRAVDLDPGFVLARANLAIALFYVPDVAAARREALEASRLDPRLPQSHYVVGLAARIENRPEESAAAFRRVLELVPDDVGANVRLAELLLDQDKPDGALPLLATALRVEPFNASAAYNLAMALKAAGRGDEADSAMARFFTLRRSPYRTMLGQKYLEQGRYAEAVASSGAEPRLVDRRVPDVRFVEAPLPALPAVSSALAIGRRLTVAEARATAEAGRPAQALLDADGDGALDLVAATGSGLRLLHNVAGRFQPVEPSGLPDVKALALVAGDFDNDGREDLLVLAARELRLLHNEGGRFADVTASAGLPPLALLSVSAAFVDVDHDGDLDLFIAGLADLEATKADGPLLFPGEFAPAPSRLFRNDGDGTFTDVTEESGVGILSHALSVAPTDFDDRRDVDLVVLREDAPPLVLQNQRDGTFRDVAAGVGMAAAGPGRALAAGDLNKDGFPDFVLGRAAGPARLVLSDGRGRFAVRDLGSETSGAEAVMFLDYDADGLLDLVLAGGRGLRIVRNVGDGWSDVTARAVAAQTTAGALAAADLDGDGRVDLVLAGGKGWALRRAQGGTNRTLQVRLQGRVSSRDGVGAKVDMRAGSLRQRIETSAATPPVAPSDVAFGLGTREKPDAVRVLWASGVLQAELPDAPTPVLALVELDRKPSSCPFLFAWDGARFEFVTDFLGGGEMGSWLAPGLRNTPDPEEYVRLPGERVRARDGRIELRVTNELEEVLYLDRARLLAVEHPEDVWVFPSEGMTSPPRPFSLQAVRDPRPPTGAWEDDGRDVLDRLRAVDRTWPDGFRLRRIRGYAEEHGLTLDLTGLPASHTKLLLTGWTDYAFSSDNVAAHQSGLALRPPTLQAEGPDGTWTTLVTDLGVPVGRPQTIALDLPVPRPRRVRIVTGMRVYWDQALVAVPARTALRTVELPLVAAVLRERGFSAEASPDGREPIVYDYERVSTLSPWKALSGSYTRVGDVRELLGEAEDLFVVAQPGDEVALAFTAPPAAAAGHARTYLFHGDGFSKEMDINSASPDVVDPLPYHGMRDYPYPPEEAPARVKRLAERAAAFNTRNVTRTLPSLERVATALTARP